jgi:hypothetical protein
MHSTSFLGALSLISVIVVDRARAAVLRGRRRRRVGCGCSGRAGRLVARVLLRDPDVLYISIFTVYHEY